jgi:cytochrome P450 family 4
MSSVGDSVVSCLGPRNCIGQKFAMLEMKLTIARIIQRFEIKVSKENEDPPINVEIVLKSQNGVNLNFHPRSLK